MHSCSVWKRKIKDFLKHSGLLSVSQESHIQLRYGLEDRAVMLLIADPVAQPILWGNVCLV